VYKTLKRPYFIAEISANHCGNFIHAKKLIKCAKKNGADAVKLQTYTANSMTIKSNKKYFQINEGLWKGYNLWDLYDEAHTPISWHKKLFDYAHQLGITIFSTPFDETAVDLLEELNCPFYKIASLEMTDLTLIEKIAKTKKPIIMSTGTANLDEIEMSYNYARKKGVNDITLLYCVSKYPSKNSDFNINNIKILKEKFECRIGFSDHSKDNNVAKTAVAAGAEVVEKHIALENQVDGLDIDFSLKGDEINIFRDSIDATYSLLGSKKFIRDKSELKSKLLRRSVFVSSDIRKGEYFTTSNIKRVRPGHGVDPKYYKLIMNRRSPFNFTKGDPITKRVLKSLKIK
tara:strand:+ start:2788 stop:3822 length:1035 start_codon:yes stop_codon:yes gene_type:complete